jgi:predicted transcriptional regulator
MQPCETAAKYKVPAIKAKLARELKKKGKSQKEIAKILRVTEAAVSQYLSKKRAKASIKSLKIKSKPNECICELCGLCKFEQK